MANSNIAALRESAETQIRLNPQGVLMLDPQFALFCADEHSKALAQIQELEKLALPDSLRDPKVVLERGGLLNSLLNQPNEMARLLGYLLDHSKARALLSDSYIEDVRLAVGSPAGGEGDCDHVA